ncbi:aminotransferase class V-fold PLP-dependent enzyme [Aequorivita sediminis]|uniref:aminotransferase class V-fold PLP-dependent enzyme n=1 Tax=Aequorivita sediminis TaxID=3073653 RepID=UPI0028AFC875|nr:aminotransferase class V-fold PLP-dependent enzyme [Aequorivita sp. F6058]
MKEIRKHFPVLNTTVYLDTAANGLIPKPVIDWRRIQDDELLNNPVAFRAKHQEIIEGTKVEISRSFGASFNTIALIPNFSFGINSILDGLSKNQKILLLNNDYPSVNWPVEHRKFNVCYAEIDENLETNIITAIEKHEPDVFIFSIVQWLSGIKIDFSSLKQLKENYPHLLLIADGTQYLGTEVFNFETSPIDILATSCYKWLTSGFGNGILFIKKYAQHRIAPKTIGFNSAATFESSASDTAFIKHFEPGHQDTLNYGSIAQAIRFREEIGREVLYQQIKSISELAKESFAEIGLLSKNTLLRQTHSSIFNLQCDKDVFKRLRENNIVCSLRGNGIRVGFHYYNTEDDLEHLLQVLKQS